MRGQPQQQKSRHTLEDAVELELVVNVLFLDLEVHRSCGLLDLGAQSVLQLHVRLTALEDMM